MPRPYTFHRAGMSRLIGSADIDELRTDGDRVTATFAWELLGPPSYG